MAVVYMHNGAREGWLNMLVDQHGYRSAMYATPLDANESVWLIPNLSLGEIA